MFKPMTTAAIFTMLSLMAVGSLLMKLGATGDPAKRWLFNIAGTQSLAGVFSYGMALVLYAWLLKTVPLNIMQSLMTIQFITIIFASAIFLAEPIPPLRWIGIALIVAGLWVVAVSVDRTGG